MAITQVGATSASTASNGFTIQYPSGLQDGDFLVVVVRSWAAAMDANYPIQSYLNDWTQRLVNTSRGGGHNLHIFTKVWKPQQESSFAYASLAFSGNGNHHATCLAFRGVHPDNPVNAVAQGYDTSASYHATPAISPTTDRCMVVRAVASQVNSATGSCEWANTVTEFTDGTSSAGYSHLTTAGAIDVLGTVGATCNFPSYGIMATIALAPRLERRIQLGVTAVPLMRTGTEVEVAPSVPISAPSGGSGGVMADEMNRVYTASENSYSSKYHRWIGHLNTSKPIGLLVHLHGDGAFEFNNPTSTWMLGGTNGIVQVAKDRNMLVICPLTPDDKNTTWWHWYGKEENSRWLVSLIEALCGAYNIDRYRIWFTTYSGGSQFLTKYYLPRFSSSIRGGGAIVFGGGNENATTLTPFVDPLQSRFSMHWLTGLLDDGTEPGSDGFNALAAARAGEAWYRQQGFITTLNTPAGQGHDWNGTFGTRVKAILDANMK